MFSPSRRPSRTVPRPARPRPTFRPRLEALEDRTAPAMLLVTSLADDGGAGTLRSLIAVAQTNGDASNTIDFDPSLAGGVITLTAAPLNPTTGIFPGPTAFDVNKTLTILGSGQTITRASTAVAFRFFFVEATGSLTLSNLSLSNGLALGFAGSGGAAGLGGAIYNRGALTVQGVTFTGDAASGGSGGASYGGGGLGSGPSASVNQGGNPNAAVGGFGSGGYGGESFGVAGMPIGPIVGGAGGNGGFGGGGGKGGTGGAGLSGPGPGGSGGAGGFGGGGGAGGLSSLGYLFMGQSPPNGAGGAGGFGGGAGPGGGAGMGGAIFSEQGSVTITNSTLTANSAVGGSGGFGPNGGGGGGSGFGGAVFILSGTLTLSGSTFSGNTVTAGMGTPAGAVVGPDGYNAATGQAFTSLTPQEQFVQALYLDALGRTGIKAELDGWVALFNSGLSQADVQAAIAAGIESSPEARDHLVRGWYVTFLGRAAPGGEEQGWVNQLLAGAPEEQVLSAILATPEFYSRAQTLSSSGTADQNFVQALYRLLLGRTGSDAETAGWIDVLPQLGRQGVAVRFLVSAEYRADLVQSYYELLLHRPADPQGLDGWVFSGLGEVGVRVGIEASPEFFTNG